MDAKHSPADPSLEDIKRGLQQLIWYAEWLKENLQNEEKVLHHHAGTLTTLSQASAREIMEYVHGR